MEIKQDNHPTRGKFYAGDLLKPAGRMDYTWKNNSVMDIVHTEVSDEQEGKGLGLELVQAGVKYARDNDIKIIPSCSFAAAMFDKHKDEWNDVLENDLN